jgi:hypothetical protein
MTANANRAPRGLVYSSWFLGVATLLCAFAVANGRFALDAKNNALVYGGSFLLGAPLGFTPFGLKTLPWLIADLALPLAATVMTVFAYRRFLFPLHSIPDHWSTGLCRQCDRGGTPASRRWLDVRSRLRRTAGSLWQWRCRVVRPRSRRLRGCLCRRVCLVFTAAIVTLVSVLRHRSEPPMKAATGAGV